MTSAHDARTRVLVADDEPLARERLRMLLRSEPGLELVAEWTWLKVTDRGEPVFDLDGFYRKPWERLLIARRRGESRSRNGSDGAAIESGTIQHPIKPRIIVAVPDVHSRKPNLRPLFGDLLQPGFSALEVFARNLTAGWWSWGDEVLRFQESRHWTSEE